MNKSVYEVKGNIINYDTKDVLGIMKIITVKCYMLTLIEKTDNLLKFKSKNKMSEFMLPKKESISYLTITTPFNSFMLGALTKEQMR